jgi:hypothetical protein
MMQKTKINYGHVDKVLHSFGFSRVVFERNGKGVRYEHEATGASVLLPLFPVRNRVFLHHFMVVRSTLDDFGIAKPPSFYRRLRKAGAPPDFLDWIT